MAWHDPQTKRGPRFPRRLVTVVSFLLFTTVNFNYNATAQEPEDVIKVRTDLVAVPLIVTDSRGRRVPGLKTDDFALVVDGHAAKIDYFASGTERVALLFALDVSGSARGIFAQQREAALSLFARFGRGSRVAVLHFGDFVRLTIPFTTNTDAAQNALNFQPKENSGTAIFDGAAAAVRSFDGTGGFWTERRIVILISDGFDTLSSTSYAKVIDIARARGVSFYVVHFPLFAPRDGRLEARPPSKGFRDVAEQTGGRYFKIGDAKSALDPHPHYDLAPVFQAIEDDLRGQYVVGFYPGQSARDGRSHLVTISLSKPRKGFTVHQLKTTYSLSNEP